MNDELCAFCAKPATTDEHIIPNGYNAIMNPGVTQKNALTDGIKDQRKIYSALDWITFDITR